MFASIIIYTYDRKEYILSALKSVVSQDVGRGNFEIIIVKGFEDEVLDRQMKSQADIVLTVKEKGHGKKLAEGIRQSRGDVIFILDDDDEFETSRIRICMNYFEKDHDLVFLHNSINKINNAGKMSIEPEERAPPRILTLHTNELPRYLISSFIRYRANWYSSCMGFKKEVFENHLEVLEQVNQSVDPFLFFLALSTEGRMVLIPDRLTKYRIHTSTTNYILPYREFIERRKKFYDNSSKIFRKAVAFSSGLHSFSVILSLSSQMDFVSSFMKEDIGRRGQIRKFLKYIQSFQVVFTRYQFVWLILGVIKLFSSRVAMRFFYNYYIWTFAVNI